MNNSASARGITSDPGSSSTRRTSLPNGVPPGSCSVTCRTPRASSDAASRASCVVLPEPSPPSKTMILPRPAESCVTGSPQGDDRARGAPLDAVGNPVVHPHHELVEVLSCGDQSLAHAVRLHLREERVQFLFHLRRGSLATLDHRLRVLTQLLHLPKHRDGITVVAQCIIRALHSLIFRTLSNETSDLLRLFLDHSRSSLRVATTKRSRPVRSTTTRTFSYPPSPPTYSATLAPRRTSTSRASTPPPRSTGAA